MNWIQCLTLTFIIQATLACFITDCPHGLGKRSDISLTKKPKWKFPQVSLLQQDLMLSTCRNECFLVLLFCYFLLLSACVCKCLQVTVCVNTYQYRSALVSKCQYVLVMTSSDSSYIPRLSKIRD